MKIWSENFCDFGENIKAKTIWINMPECHARKQRLKETQFKNFCWHKMTHKKNLHKKPFFVHVHVLRRWKRSCLWCCGDEPSSTTCMKIVLAMIKNSLFKNTLIKITKVQRWRMNFWGNIVLQWLHSWIFYGFGACLRCLSQHILI